MCGRYTLISNPEAIRRIFELPLFDERLAVPRYNIAPTQPVVVVRRQPFGDGREFVPMRWGFIPAWVKDTRAAPLIINARAEGLASKAAFANAFRRRRCLVPASGFYEWQARGKGPKQPFAVRPDASALIAFAGLWETWCGADGSEIDTATIITVPCNESLRRIHHRMPAIVAPADYAAWLADDTDPADVHVLLQPAPEDLLTCVPVSTRVNAAANDDPQLWEAMPEAAEMMTPEPRQRQLFDL